jgi:hypothetical protein
MFYRVETLPGDGNAATKTQSLSPASLGEQLQDGCHVPFAEEIGQ